MIKQVVIFFLAVLTVDSFSPANYCTIPDKYYHEAKCKKFQCTDELCSTDENKCKALVGWTALLELKISFITKTLKSYSEFVLSIKNCTKNHYVMMKSLVCENKKVCYEYKKWTSWQMFKTINIRLRTTCPCRGKYSYDCGNNRCAIDKKTCQIFKDETYKEFVKKIKSCN